MPSLLISTTNPGKYRELSSLLSDLNLHLVSLGDISLRLEVEEDGETYAQNASSKAVAFAKASQMPALADDSGLEVDALEGLPGLHSARFTGEHSASDAERRTLLLSRLVGKPKPWTAHFHCTVAFSTPAGQCIFGDGDCHGEITEQESGSNGFGYDPLFMLKDLHKTMAQLTLEEKNQLSHRAFAIRNLLPALHQFFEKY
jgi:XTP/dITP diphosphohydrolase